MKTESAVHRASLLLAIVMLCLARAEAHHSTAAEFDPNKPVTFTGTVQKVVWMNPHIYTYVEVRQPGAAAVVYHVEGSAPNTLFRAGWRKESLQVGAMVTVSGWRAKNPDSTNVGQATITTADGRRIYSGAGPARADD